MHSIDKQKRLHFDVVNVGLRAQATAVGLVKLCVELRDAGVLPDAALTRIKDAIADEVSVAGPRRRGAQDYRREVRDRLDQLFAGETRGESLSPLTVAPNPTGDPAADVVFLGSDRGILRAIQAPEIDT